MRVCDLQFLQSEPFAGADSGVILEGGTVNDGPQEACGRARGNLGSLLQSLEAPCLLLPGLIKPRLHPPLPVFLEVRIGYHPIALRRHLDNLHNRPVRTTDD